MKIISKFKDYYDWVVFETDNRKVYVRDTKAAIFLDNFYKKNENTIDKATEQFFDFKPDKLSKGRLPNFDGFGYHMVYLYFCGEVYLGLCNSTPLVKKYYWELDKLPVDDLRKIQKYIEKNKRTWFWGYISWYGEKLGLLTTGKKDEEQVPVRVDINKQLNCPVILSDRGSFVSSGIILNPNMSDIGFKLLSPERAYQEIYNFIEYKEPSNLPGSPTDMARYVGKGFDAKTSFRPKMKDNK